MTLEQKRSILLASKEELTRDSYVNRLWLAARNMPYSRRIWPEALCDAIYHFDGTFIMPDGRIWPVPDIDYVMGDTRWISMWFEERDGKPRRTTYQIERLRLFDLYFKINYPLIARHFGR